jgi:5-(carboxyamino)imidazole ribonucleotide synthase
LSTAAVLRIGIVGAGQLGRMLALAAYPLGLKCIFLDRSAEAPAAQIAPIIIGDLADPHKLKELAGRSDVLTFDWENVPFAALDRLSARTAIHPPPEALRISQDRLLEKALFTGLEIPVAPHSAVNNYQDLVRACATHGIPGILKTRRLGYDGKGQVMINHARERRAAWKRLQGQDLIYEKRLRFSREISIVGARSTTGETVYYPLACNTHRAGILRYSIAPYRDAALERMARGYLKRTLDALAYVGVLTIEFFVVNGRLIANEIAPRVHNSAHWTIEGCISSQFENHLRAICGLPLGSTRPLGHAAMINFIGKMPQRRALLAVEGLSFHDYGKQARPGRKLGHCTILRSTPAQRDKALRSALRRVDFV